MIVGISTHQLRLCNTHYETIGLFFSALIDKVYLVEGEDNKYCKYLV